MKLIDCYVENFGKLHDYSISFGDGENVICKENGWGKSTFAAFVRAMFYGLEGKRKQKIEDNEYTRYTPWQGGVFGGRLTFETNGKQYVITRRFGSQEEFELRDAKTNLLSTDFSENIGEELFKVNRESFMRTVFIGQNDCETEANDDINSKIGNLTDNTNDLNNYEKADKALKEIMAGLNPNRVTGSIRKRSGEITEVKREVTVGERISESIEAYQQFLKNETEEYEKKKQEKDMLTREQSRVSKLQGILAKKDTWNNLKQTCKSRDAALQKAKEKFPGDVPDMTETLQMMETCSKVAATRERMNVYCMAEAETTELSNLEIAFKERMPKTQEIDAMQEAVRELGRRQTELDKKQNELSAQNAIISALAKNQKTISPIVMIGAVLAVIGVILMVATSVVAGIAVTVVGAILLVVGFLGMKKEKEPEVPPAILELEAEIKQENTKIQELSQKIEAYLEQYGNAIGAYISAERYAEHLYTLKTKVTTFENLQQKSESFAIAQKEYDTAYASITSFLTTYQYEPTQEISRQLAEIKETIGEYQMAERLFKEAKAQLKEFEAQNDISLLQNEATEEHVPSLEDLNEKASLLVEAMDEIRRRMQGYNRNLESLQEQYDEWEEKKERLEELLKIQEEETKKYALIEKTKLYLGKAKESLTARYIGPIMENFARYYGMITGDSTEHIHMDANANITVDELGKQRETETLSQGYQDLIGVCLRVAFVDAMYTEELPVLIMDDPFTNLDDQKVETARKVLQQISEKYQIIYFTCSKSRS